MHICIIADKYAYIQRTTERQAANACLQSIDITANTAGLILLTLNRSFTQIRGIRVIKFTPDEIVAKQTQHITEA